MTTLAVTTVDFKLDDTETPLVTSSPSVKRIFNEANNASIEVDSQDDNSVTISSQISPIVASPDYKRRNSLEACDLDPILDQNSEGQIPAIFNSQSLMSWGSQSSVSNINNSVVTTHYNNRTMTSPESEESDANCTIQTQTPITDELSDVKSDLETAEEGSTLSENPNSEKSNIERETEPDMMSVLLDIRERIHTMEVKGEDMITKASMKEMIVDMQKPICNDIHHLKDTLNVHGIALAKRENVELALGSRIALTSTELKTHIDIRPLNMLNSKSKPKPVKK